MFSPSTAIMAAVTLSMRSAFWAGVNTSFITSIVTSGIFKSPSLIRVQVIPPQEQEIGTGRRQRLAVWLEKVWRFPEGSGWSILET